MFIRDDDDEGTSPFNTALTVEQIEEGLEKSPDGGCTLLLAKLQISEIKAFEVKALANLELRQECALERLALGNNRLFSLPSEFSMLNRLRYLNLKHNCLTSVPDVLTQMSALDTLDLSNNKIMSLPSQPGRLLQLRVFSLSKNKLIRIPAYLARFRELEVLRIDRNPLEYPSKSIMASFGGDMGVFNDSNQVQNFQSWLDSDGSGFHDYDDSGYSERLEWDLERHLADDSWQRDEATAVLTPHFRTFSSDSSYTPMFESPEASNQQLKPLDSPTASLSETHQPSMSNNVPKSFGPPDVEPLHIRTVSHGSTLHKSSSNLVSSKKSLPDLRMTETRLQPPFGAGHGDQTPVLFSAFGRRDVVDASKQSTADDARYMDTHVPVMTVERNSYFRRSAAIFINKSLPPALMQLLETARSILFAMSQMYQSLEHYSSHVVNDRLSNLFKKVLDPANISMLHLIRSLDRFDDVSQSSMPSSAVCRALVESCRDTVTIFRKAMSLMTLQIGLEPPDDVRYMRWLILELYGTSVEIGSAWQCLLPYTDSLKPLLHGSTFMSSSVYGSDNFDHPEGYTYGEQSLAPAVRLRSLDSAQSTGRLRTTRRHAGSFSSKDVQIGKELPSYDIVPTTPGGGHHTPALRTPKRQITVPLLSSSTPNGSIDATPGFSRHMASKDLMFDHQRQGSQNSLFDTSPGAPLGSPVATKIRVSQDVLQAVRVAVQIAPSVWQMIEETMSQEMLTKLDLKDNLETARFVTKKLTTMLTAFDDKDTEFDINLLREHGHLFLRTLVRLSNILKQSGGAQTSSSLKASMVKLTNATENFAILLHVSSSPPDFGMSSTRTTTLHPPGDHGAPAGLFRSKSAQPSIGSMSRVSPFPGS
ncbi:RAM signaling pathway protein-domain-containing protein [Panaeolus papilionaceus]|nr:RAM signaling pathway protein-domain-containing protein [Panaeolus papilionaceus]